MLDLAVIILAAGKGTRMQSDLPKVFHEIAGKPMLSFVIETVRKLSPRKCFIVVGHQRRLIMDYYRDYPVDFVIQREQRGTGHAVMRAEPFLRRFSGNVLVLAGDVPLIKAKTLRRLIFFHESRKAAVTDLTAKLPDAGSYGRVIRKKNGEVIKIVEKKDASSLELKIKEINTGIFCFDRKALFAALKKVRSDNAQKEYYLTDTLEIIRKMGLPAFAYCLRDPAETFGVNTKEELAEIGRILRKCKKS